MNMKEVHGQVITAAGPVHPRLLGRVLMHEHLNSDIYDWEKDALITEEQPDEERRQYLLADAVPHLKRCAEFGCHAIVDCTMPPWRAWPTVYREVTEQSRVNMIMSTGFYRQVEIGRYWVKSVEESIWPFVLHAPVEELADYCIAEIVEGIHGTDIHAGIIKLGTSAPEMTDAEVKTFRAAARAQIATGVAITTHCTQLGAESTQLQLLADEGVDLNRVIIGHTAAHLGDPDCRKVCLEWMRRGANFLPTNLDVRNPTRWQPLINAIHEVFDAGSGDRLSLGLDSGYCSESGPFAPVTFMPPPPFAYMFTDVLPAFWELGLTAAEEEQMLATNPQRVLPVQ